MSVSPSSDPTVGGFLYVTLGSLAAGMVTSGFRWLLIDTLLHLTGLTQPTLDFSRLQSNLEAFQLAVEHNYRHYQFYANTMLAAAFLQRLRPMDERDLVDRRTGTGLHFGSRTSSNGARLPPPVL